MKVFVLEDDPLRIRVFEQMLVGHETVYAQDVERARKAFDKWGPFDVMFLDHDLGGQVYVPSEDPTTGYAFLKSVVDRLGDTQVVVHSYNEPAARRMMALRPDGADWKRIPFNARMIA